MKSCVPDDATHYFLWWDQLHVYKRVGKRWFWFSGGQWSECFNSSHHKVKRGLFGYYQIAGGYKHKLHKITWSR